jgi:hypothetical protein
MTYRRRRFLLELEEVPAPVPVEVRLRRAAKVLLRGFDLRCREVQEIQSAAGPGPKGDGPVGSGVVDGTTPASSPAKPPARGG